MDTEYVDYEQIEGFEKDNAEIFESFEEMLISAVQDRPCIWDQRLDVRLRGLDTVKQAWNEISELLNADPKLAQKKWKNLRDTFRRKHQERKTYVPSGSGAVKKSAEWKFYHQMEFLLPTIQFRRTSSNCSDINADAGQRTIVSQFLTTSRTSLSQPPECIELQGPLSRISPAPVHRRETTSPFNVPTTPSPSTSPAPSTSSDLCERRRRSSSRDSIPPKRLRDDEEFHNLFKEISRKPSEQEAFCNFLQCRLEKLTRKYFLKVTNTILLEVMKVEAEQNEERE